ncbi:PorT [Sphingobacterium oryzagri]|uniref:PorT n=1 Tax=Sphingobacterium oryzagri TaxID=3025669 RepID=A0ABY7WK42_9SPHI|nr:PorT [Sphingobacterium sp. KACC 22765]WDF69951.1 PorT [Sphingobacterium sp. KACC 22765]
MSRLIVYVFLCYGFIATVNAQNKVSLPFSSFYDENAWLSMGLQYNYVNSTYRVGLKNDWAAMGNTSVPPNNDLYIGNFQAIETVVGHGMSVGLPIELRFTDNLSTTFTPTFIFINKSGISYQDTLQTSQPIVRNMRHAPATREGSNYNAFEFPLNIRFRSDEKVLKNKFNRYRGYMTAGFRYTRWIDIVGEYNSWMAAPADNRPQPLVMKPGYFSWEAGLGVEIFFPFFRMSPEIKFIQSFADVLDRSHPFAQDNAFMTPLDKTLIRNIQFSLIFQ